MTMPIATDLADPLTSLKGRIYAKLGQLFWREPSNGPVHQITPGGGGGGGGSSFIYNVFQPTAGISYNTFGGVVAACNAVGGICSVFLATGGDGTIDPTLLAGNDHGIDNIRFYGDGAIFFDGATLLGTTRINLNDKVQFYARATNLQAVGTAHLHDSAVLGSVSGGFVYDLTASGLGNEPSVFVYDRAYIARIFNGPNPTFFANVTVYGEDSNVVGVPRRQMSLWPTGGCAVRCFDETAVPWSAACASIMGTADQLYTNNPIGNTLLLQNLVENDWSPDYIQSATINYVDNTFGVTGDITGIARPVGNFPLAWNFIGQPSPVVATREITLINVSAADSIRLINQSALSVAENRLVISGGGPGILTPNGGTARCIYSSVAGYPNRWFVTVS